MFRLVPGALAFGFSFTARNVGRIAARVALPALVGFAILWGVVSTYLGQLLAYVHNPSEGLASRILGLVAVSILALVYAHSVLVSSVTVLALELPEDSGPLWWRQCRVALRLYFANLRFALLLCLMLLAPFGLCVLARALVLPGLVPLGEALFLLALFYAWVRCESLLAPVAIQPGPAAGVRAAFRLSAGYFWPLTLLLIAFIALWLMVLNASEMALFGMGLTPDTLLPQRLADRIIAYRAGMVPDLALMSLTYLVVVVPMAAARAQAWRVIMRKQPQAVMLSPDQLRSPA